MDRQQPRPPWCVQARRPRIAVVLAEERPSLRQAEAWTTMIFVIAGDNDRTAIAPLLPADQLADHHPKPVSVDAIGALHGIRLGSLVSEAEF